MKIKYQGIIYEGKYFKDMTRMEVKESTFRPERWDATDVFVYTDKTKSPSMCYIACGYEILKEETNPFVELKKFYDQMIEAGFTEKQAWDLIGKGLDISKKV